MKINTPVLTSQVTEKGTPRRSRGLGALKSKIVVTRPCFTHTFYLSLRPPSTQLLSPHSPQEYFPGRQSQPRENYSFLVGMASQSLPERPGLSKGCGETCSPFTQRGPALPHMLLAKPRDVSFSPPQLSALWWVEEARMFIEGLLGTRHHRMLR